MTFPLSGLLRQWPVIPSMNPSSSSSSCPVMCECDSVAESEQPPRSAAVPVRVDDDSAVVGVVAADGVTAFVVDGIDTGDGGDVDNGDVSFDDFVMDGDDFADAACIINNSRIRCGPLIAFIPGRSIVNFMFTNSGMIVIPSPFRVSSGSTFF